MSIQWQSNYASALKMAQAEKKFLLVDFFNPN